MVAVVVVVLTRMVVVGTMMVVDCCCCWEVKTNSPSGGQVATFTACRYISVKTSVHQIEHVLQNYYQCCGSKYIEFGSRIFAQLDPDPGLCCQFRKKYLIKNNF